MCVCVCVYNTCTMFVYIIVCIIKNRASVGECGQCLPVQSDAFGLGTVDSMIPTTAGNTERETPNTRNTETACTQI